MAMKMSRSVSQFDSSTLAAYRMARSMRSFSNVLMPCSCTLPTGNRSSAESSTVFTYCRVFTALGPGMTALCRAA